MTPGVVKIEGMHTVPRLYQSFQPSHYQLQLSLDRVGRTFRGTVTIDGTWSSGDTIALHARDLTVSSAHVGGAEVSHTTSGDTLTLTPSTVAYGSTQVVVAFSGEITDGMHGVYPCYYELDGAKKELLATQFESHHAREVFPCVDEPEAKATFDVTLTTEPGSIALGNMPIANQQTADGQLVTTFETTPVMSPYLLAFVVGDLQKKTAHTKEGTEVNVYSTRAQAIDNLDFALDTAVKAIEYFNDYFGVPYPLPKCDHVALPDFSSAAMENWGLITYREVVLLANATTAVSLKEDIAMVIAHETSHQWFGNLVTMRWWDDLWLNESFATFMSYLAVDAIFPDWRIWLSFSSGETFSALRRDWLPGVQAVRTEVNHPDEITTLFDPSIVYAKGARLMAMLHRYVGDEAFRTGMAQYFRSHAHANTSGDDLWQALGDACGKDVKAFMHRWIEQPGLPVVTATLTDGQLSLSQQRFLLGEQSADDTLWPIPLAASLPELPELLDTPSLSLPLASPQPLLLNTGNTGHYVVAYDTELRNRLKQAIADGSLAAVDRLALLHETSLLARAGRLTATDLFHLLAVYKNETEEPVWDMIARVVGDVRRLVEADEATEQAFKAFLIDLALPMYERLGWRADSSESEADTKLRATILGLLAYAEYKPVVTEGLKLFHETKQLETIDGELRGIVCVAAGKFGTDQDFERLFTLYKTSSYPEIQDDALAGLTATRDTAKAEQLLAAITDSNIVRPQDVGRWFAYLIGNRYARQATWDWMTANWQWLTDTFEGDKSYDMFPRYAGARLSTRDWQHAYQTFFAPLSERPALRRAIDLGTKDIAAWADWIERDFDALKQAILAYTKQ